MANSSLLTGCSIGGAVPFVESANVTLSRTTLQTTALGDSWETNVYGVARISGSIEVLFDKSDHSAMTNQCSTAGTSLAATFTWNTGETWSGNLLITEASPNMTVDTLVKASFSFVGTGTWTV